MSFLATLDDIARELGISKSTVSKALSGAKDVSKAMRRNVLEKAVELGAELITCNNPDKVLEVLRKMGLHK